MTTTCASGVFAPVDGKKTPPAQGAKVSIRANWSGMQQLMQRQPPYHNQIRTSTDAVGVPNAAINATCVRACRGNMVRKFQEVQCLWSLWIDQIHKMGCQMQQSMQHALGHVEVIWWENFRKFNVCESTKLTKFYFVNFLLYKAIPLCIDGSTITNIGDLLSIVPLCMLWMSCQLV